MRLYCFFIFVFLAFILNNAAAQQPMTSDQYKVFVGSMDYKKHALNAEKFIDLSQKENTVVLDLRSRQEFDQSHLSGAKFLGPDVDEKALSQLAPSKDTTILLYCGNSLEQRRSISLTVTRIPEILLLGYNKVFYLENYFDQSPADRQLIQQSLK